MIYEDDSTTREKLFELRKRNRCQQCGGRLDVFMDFDRGKAFLACADWRRTHHEGIEREASPPLEKNIPTRREEMVEELGEEKATKLERYEGVVSLTRAQAMEILKTIWPKAPEIEVMKAGIICHQYGLNPLMKHLFLIPFKRREEGRVVGEDWVTVLGISSNRLIARRRHNYTYLDLTPRRMAKEEEEKINGEVDNTRVWAITKLKDLDTGAEAMGIGSWPKDEEPYGVDKGNTKLNMACVRSEREALDRLYPAEMPQGVEVMEEKFIGADYSLISPGVDETGLHIAAKKQEQPTKGAVTTGEPVLETKGEQKSGEARERAAAPPVNPNIFKTWGELAQGAAILGVNPSEVFKRARVKKWEELPDFRDAWNYVEEIITERRQSPPML